MELNYLPIFIIFVVAWIVPMALSWLEITKVPSVIVEIIMGVVIGPFVLDLVPVDDPTLNFLSYTGFLFLIFLSGLAIDVEKIVNSFPRNKLQLIDILSNTFLVAMLIYIGGLILSVPVVYAISAAYDLDKAFMVILLPSVALSIIVPIIKNDGEIGRKFGQILLLQGAIATIMTILLIAIYSGIRKNGFRSELLLFLIIFVVFFVGQWVGKYLMRAESFKKVMYKLAHAASQIRIRGAVTVMLLFVVIASAIKTEAVLGAFFAGILISMFMPKNRSALLFKLDGMGYGFFVPIFFIMVGVKLDLSPLKNIGNSLTFIAILVAAFYFIQVIPALIMTKVFGLKKALAAGSILTSRLGLTIATAQIGIALGLISPAANTGIVVSAIITCLLSPMLYNLLNVEITRLYSIYVVGGGVAGTTLAERFRLHGISTLVIDPDQTKIKELQSRGLDSRLGGHLDLEVYQSLKIRPVDTIVVLTDDEQKNVEVAQLLRNDLVHDKIITMTARPELYEAHKNLNEVQVVNAYDVIASQIENEIMRPTTASALTDSFGIYSVEEIRVNNKDIDRKLVMHIPFPHAGSLVAVRRNKEIFIPHGDSRILIGDIITVIGNSEALEEFRRLLK